MSTTEEQLDVLCNFVEVAEKELGLADLTDEELTGTDLPGMFVADDPVIRALVEVRKVMGWVTLHG